MRRKNARCLQTNNMFILNPPKDCCFLHEKALLIVVLTHSKVFLTTTFSPSRLPLLATKTEPNVPRPIGSSFSNSSLQLNTGKSAPKSDCSAFAAVDGLIQGTYLFASHIAPTVSNDEEYSVESTCKMPMLQISLARQICLSICQSVWKSHLCTWELSSVNM